MKNLFASSWVALSLLGAGSPAWAGSACKVVPTVFNQVITSPGGTMSVITDRSESVAAFFRRNHVVAAQLVQVDPLTIQARTKVKLQLPSNNFQGQNQAKYSTVVDLAPPSAVFRNAKFSPSQTILLMQDAGDANLFHPVGYMIYPSAQFFTSDVSLAAEKTTSRELIYSTSNR